jgi:hypothetical protein
MPNLKLRLKKDLSSFRRMALGTWTTAYDPTVYGSMALPMEAASKYMAEFTEKTGRRITVTHLMAKAVGEMFAEVPDANAVIRWNRIYIRERIGVFFQVEMRDQNGEIDLSGATVLDPEQKSLLKIVDEFTARVSQVRRMKDRQLENSRSLVKKIPYFSLNAFMKLYSFLIYTLNIDPKYLDAPRDAFGSAMITNVGSLGLEEAFVPLVPFSRVPVLLALGKVRDVPVVEGGDVKVEKQLKVFATFDHRVLDGAHAAAMARSLKSFFEDPYARFGDIDEQVREAGEQEGRDEDEGRGEAPEKADNADNADNADEAQVSETRLKASAVRPSATPDEAMPETKRNTRRGGG